MEGKRNNIHMVQHRNLIAYLAVIGGLILLPSFSFSAYAEPPVDDDCIAYAYTDSGNHYFLLGDNKTVFGQTMIIKHNCDYIEVSINGNFSAYTENTEIEFPVNPGFYEINIQSNNSTFTYSNVTFLPDRLTWEFEYYDWQNDNDYSFEEYVSLTAATAKANWASILSIVIVYALVVMVYWNLINSYIDRNFCEEVKE